MRAASHHRLTPRTTLKTLTRSTTKTPSIKAPSRRSAARSKTSHSSATRPAAAGAVTSSPHRGDAKQLDSDSGLAICLFGLGAKMYDSEYEEEVRKQAVMSEVLPDAATWEKWAKTEAPLRQGRGWYPILDRHFLELLVISEIACLSHPLNMPSVANQAERIHRHATRVRRVACERIGAERLHAYCDRVQEAFEAYVRGGYQRYAGLALDAHEAGVGASAVSCEESGSDDSGDEDADGSDDDKYDEEGLGVLLPGEEGTVYIDLDAADDHSDKRDDSLTEESEDEIQGERSIRGRKMTHETSCHRAKSPDGIEVSPPRSPHRPASADSKSAKNPFVDPLNADDDDDDVVVEAEDEDADVALDTQSIHDLKIGEGSKGGLFVDLGDLQEQDEPDEGDIGMHTMRTDSSDGMDIDTTRTGRSKADAFEDVDMPVAIAVPRIKA